MSDFICGKLISSRGSVWDFDSQIFLDLIKVAASHHVNVVFLGNIAQPLIFDMLEWTHDDLLAVPFVMTESPLSSASDGLFPLPADEEFNIKLRSLFTAIQDFFTAASTSGYFNAALLVFSGADGTSDPYPTVTTDLAGLVDTCMEKFLRPGFEYNGFVDNLHVAVAMR